MRPRRLIAVALVAAWLGGCGPLPPQAPFRDAKKLDASTSAISSACGESRQLLAFGGAHRRDFETLEATASAGARKLASVWRQNPAWIYQGETIAEIVHDGGSMLRSCGLHEAAGTLAAATRKH